MQCPDGSGLRSQTLGWWVRFPLAPLGERAAHKSPLTANQEDKKVARAENKKEEIIHYEVVNPTTAVIVRQIEDAKGRHFVDVRQFFKAEVEQEDWQPTRMGVRLNHDALAAIAKVKLPKNPTDTRTVRTSVDPGIILPPKPAKATA